MSPTEPEDFETFLREVMQSRDPRLAGFTAAQVVTGGRRRRRSRTVAASGLALVAFVAVLGIGVGADTLAGGPGRRDDGPAVTPATMPHSTSPTRVEPSFPATPVTATPVTAPPAKPPRVVSSPGSVDIGGGFRLILSTDSAELVEPGGSVGPDYADDINKAPDTTTLMISGRGIAGVFSGTHQAASAVVTVDGKAYPATILRLAGHSGWSVAYVVLPEADAVYSADSVVSITDFDAAGRPLATEAS